MTVSEKIEILSTRLLDEHRPLVEDLRRLARSLHLEFGWHYLLDLTWIISQLNDLRGKVVLDAGAGMGVLQWYLAEQGAEVISVDRESRADLPLRFRRRFRVRGLRAEDLSSGWEAYWRGFRLRGSGPWLRRWAGRLYRQGREIFEWLKASSSSGCVLIYNQDLLALRDIPSASMDAVVSVSALEHNRPEDLALIVRELMRVLRPGAPLLATLTAAHQGDWWHEPSQGWCYTAASLRRLFDLPPQVSDNYDRYDELLAELRQCDELRANLARFYRGSEGKGMPRGIWNPQYQPVGVCKIKPAEGVSAE